MKGEKEDPAVLRSAVVGCCIKYLVRYSRKNEDTVLQHHEKAENTG